MVSPFTFYRGAAKIMAADLEGTPTAGLRVQLCGDAHLSNFGVFASPERVLLFDLNDFDETLPGPFEYDVKRMAASFTIAARNNGFSSKDAETVTMRSVNAYRKSMQEFAEMRTIGASFDSSQTSSEPDRRRLLARARGLGAVARCARGPVRAQDDAGPRDRAGDPVRATRRVRTERSRPVRRPCRRRACRGHGLPHHPGADHGAVVGPGRTKSIALWSGIGGPVAALGPLLSGLLLEQFWWGSVFLITLPTRGRGSRPRRSRRSGSRQRGDRTRRQPRRHPVHAARRSADPRHQLRGGAERGSPRGRSRDHRDLGGDRLHHPTAAGGQPPVRPAHRGTTGVLGGRLRGDHRVRLPDGRDVRRPAVPPGRAAPTRPSTRASRSCRRRSSWCSSRRAPPRWSRRGARGSRCLPGTCSACWASSPCSCSGPRAVPTGRSGSATRSSVSGSASPARPPRTPSRAPSQSNGRGWPRGRPISSAISAARSCSRSSGRS